MSASDDYDLTGIHGAEVFRELPEGAQLRLTDGSAAEIVANAGDGAWLLVRITEDPENPDRVGQEEHVFFADVESVTGKAQDGPR
jgi:hypothetical protein